MNTKFLDLLSTDICSTFNFRDREVSLYFHFTPKACFLFIPILNEKPFNTLIDKKSSFSLSLSFLLLHFPIFGCFWLWGLCVGKWSSLKHCYYVLDWKIRHLQFCQIRNNYIYQPCFDRLDLSKFDLINDNVFTFIAVFL